MLESLFYFIKKRLQHGCFSVNIAKFLRTAFSIEHLWGLLLNLGRVYLYIKVLVYNTTEQTVYLPNNCKQLKTATEPITKKFLNKICQQGYRKFTSFILLSLIKMLANLKQIEQSSCRYIFSLRNEINSFSI